MFQNAKGDRLDITMVKNEKNIIAQGEPGDFSSVWSVKVVIVFSYEDNKGLRSSF